ncbi:MAG: aminoacyl-tRNA hydrolase [Betaproteobacteria bacterium]|nr:aminoacyl-tRNA hydrolase [Betaproteobacteria bacterium]
MIRLVVGLGNPGKEYERTRHNAGFWLVERFAQASGVHFRKDAKYQALVARLEGSGAWLLLPQSFMNASGRAVQMLAGFFKIKPEEILVAHDELDFAPGVARIKQGGGIAGHNGLRDISQRVASHDYWRLRIGIGHPGDKDAVADYVLHKPSQEDKVAIDEALGRALEILPLCLSGDMQGAIQKLHSSEPKPKKVEAPKAEEKPKTEAKPKAEAKPVAKKDEAKNEPPKQASRQEAPAQAKPGLLKSLFGKK